MIDRETWRAAVHGVAKSWMQLSDWPELNWIVIRGFPDVSAVKNTPEIQEPQETRIQSLGQEDSLKEGMANHSSILAWSWEAIFHRIAKRHEWIDWTHTCAAVVIGECFHSEFQKCLLSCLSVCLSVYLSISEVFEKLNTRSKYPFCSRLLKLLSAYVCVIAFVLWSSFRNVQLFVLRKG